MRADEIRVEGHDIAILDDAVAAFLIPGIGARTGGQEPRLDPLSAELGIGLMEMRPERLLGDAGNQRLPHAPDALLANCDGVADRGELFCGLHLLGERNEPLAVGDLDTMPLQRPAASRIESIHRQPPVGAPMADHKIGDLSRRLRRLLGNAPTGDEIVEGDRGPYLGDGRMPCGNMLAAGELEQDNRAVRRHENIAAGAVQPIDQHVRRAGRITDIVGVEEDRSDMVGGGERMP